jgi:hypothetical protein
VGESDGVGGAYMSCLTFEIIAILYLISLG